jgi:hypothetical protein
MMPGNHWVSRMQDGDHYYQEGHYCEVLSSYTMGLLIDSGNPSLLAKKVTRCIAYSSMRKRISAILRR